MSLEPSEPSLKAVDLSVVIPFLNEEGSLEQLWGVLSGVLGGLSGESEVILVDDGSTDGSPAIARRLRAADPRVRLITLRRHMGKSAALALGFKAARGRYVVTMDADLQDDPIEIPHLIAALESGYDLVSGWKRVRHDPLSKTVPSRIFNFFTATLSGVHLHDFNCGLKIYRKEVVKSLRLFGERHRFIPVLAHMQGFRVGEIPVTHHPRRHGHSKYGLYRFAAGFFDLITLLFRMRFLTKPLHLFGSLGMVCLLGGAFILGYLVVGWFQGRWIGNRPLFIIGVLGVVTGLQFFTLGLLGEMIAEGRTADDLPVMPDSDGCEPRDR